MSQQPTRSGVGVAVSFSVVEKGEAHREVHRFESYPTDYPPLAQGKGTEYPPYEPGSYAFSGRHDGGLLLPLREGGPHTALLEVIQEAKADNDTFLRGLIGVDGGQGAAGAAEMDLVNEGFDEVEEEEKENGDEPPPAEAKPKNKASKKEREIVSAGGGRPTGSSKKVKTQG